MDDHRLVLRREKFSVLLSVNPHVLKNEPKAWSRYLQGQLINHAIRLIDISEHDHWSIEVFPAREQDPERAPAEYVLRRDAVNYIFEGIVTVYAMSQTTRDLMWRKAGY